MKAKLITAILAVTGIAVLIGSCAMNDSGITPALTIEPVATSDVLPAEAAAADYMKITVDEAKERMDANQGAIIVDVRTQSEFDEQHIEGAILIPNETIVEAMPEQLPNLDAEILIYCRSGNRSRQASEKLIALGYTQVYDFGGIIDWPYETVSSAG